MQQSNDNDQNQKKGDETNVGQFSTIGGDYVYGDKIGGDKVGGDIYKIDTSGSTGVAIGRGAQMNISYGFDDEVLIFFAKIYKLVASYSFDNTELQAKVEQDVETIEREALSGSQVSIDSIRSALRQIQEIAPEIYFNFAEQMATASAPLPGDMRKTAQRMLEETKKSAGTGIDQVKEKCNDLLPETQRKDAQHLLSDLEIEVNKENQADLRKVQFILRRINSEYPQLREPIWNWLRAKPDQYKRIQSIAHVLLT